MQMPEPEPSGKGKLKLWQFSLRSLMILMVGVALFLGLTQTRTRLYEPVFQVLFLLVLFFQFYLLGRVAAGGRFPTGWGLARGVGACFVPAAYFVLGGKYMSPPFKSTLIVLLSASWLCWPSLAAVIWFVRRASTAEDWQTLRRVSLIHLLVETSWLALVFLAARLHGIEIRWYHDDGLWFLAFLANSVPPGPLAEPLLPLAEDSPAGLARFDFPLGHDRGNRNRGRLVSLWLLPGDQPRAPGRILQLTRGI